jgi:hypothetical protein
MALAGMIEVTVTGSRQQSRSGDHEPDKRFPRLEFRSLGS